MADNYSQKVIEPPAQAQGKTLVEILVKHDATREADDNPLTSYDRAFMDGAPISAPGEPRKSIEFPAANERARLSASAEPRAQEPAPVSAAGPEEAPLKPSGVIARLRVPKKDPDAVEAPKVLKLEGAPRLVLEVDRDGWTERRFIRDVTNIEELRKLAPSVITKTTSLNDSWEWLDASRDRKRAYRIEAVDPAQAECSIKNVGRVCPTAADLAGVIKCTSAAISLALPRLERGKGPNLATYPTVTVKGVTFCRYADWEDVILCRSQKI